MISPYISSKKTINSETSDDFMKQVREILPDAPRLGSKGDRPSEFTFENELGSLIYYHLFENESGRDLLQKLREDNFAKEHIASEGGISRSSFFEATDNRGTYQLRYLKCCSKFFI